MAKSMSGALADQTGQIAEAEGDIAEYRPIMNEPWLMQDRRQIRGAVRDSHTGDSLKRRGIQYGSFVLNLDTFYDIFLASEKTPASLSAGHAIAPCTMDRRSQKPCLRRAADVLSRQIATQDEERDGALSS